MDRVFRAGVEPAAKRRLAHRWRLLRRLYHLATVGWRRAAIGELRRLGPGALRDAGIEPYAIDAVVDDMLARNRRND